MPEQRIINIIKELNKRISEKYKDFKGSYLYGSTIKRTRRKDSDIDIIAVFEDVNWEKDFEISEIICDLMYKYDVYIDLQSYTAEKLKNNPFFQTEIFDKGLFYEAA
ncbi:MAG: hypothetical protein A2Y25_00180 [Candidatus Melainabacteria bacterium GWF2_37_15]|nr:MAG: hypothetical protein A2Y25_00180 [Candidatus Melainabacteria bacterium GWF2_37_15]